MREVGLILVSLILGCATTQDWSQAPESVFDGPMEIVKEHQTDDLKKACEITLCLTGAMNHETPSNEHFKTMCGDPRINGLVKDCGPFGCNDTFDSFLQFPLLTVYPFLLDALDQDGDGIVSAEDPICDVNLLGFSWGGVNVLSIAHHLNQDARVPTTHRGVTRAVLLDSFQPLSSQRMLVPSNVEMVLSLRHSRAPAGDCSSRAPLGPYLGFAPICSAQSTCVDFDYSDHPYERFPRASGGYLYGDEVGHCSVPDVAHETVFEFMGI